eukprot:TRINITY_DN25494_c0_g1_i1.p1 TRINITY_DN25494_c0_g1~~TRINITY_DN25494_c0_g1_i1.p1  ORF type:complete len:542 (-),score=100.02 TRINITY_DN25494_c0_g1_i1:54-1679(-)
MASMDLNNIQEEIEKLIDKGLKAYKKMDDEEKVMVVGAVICAVLLLGWFCRKICCGRRRLPSEEEAVQKTMPVITLSLPRPSGEKLGLGIMPNDQGNFTVTHISETDLVGSWNSNESIEERRVRKGDRIIWATSGQTTATTTTQISEILRGSGDITMGVALERKPEELEKVVQCVTGTIVLTDMVLKDAVEVGVPTKSSGKDLDAAAVEITKLNPAIQAWNTARRSDGSCCTQQLEVGDRIVSVNGLTNVKAYVDTKSPPITICRWKPAGSFRSDTFDVNLQKTSPSDRIGLMICPHPDGSGQAMVLDMTKDGLVAKWNETSGNRPVLRGDRIASANGKTQYAMMQEELAGMNVALRMERWMDFGASYSAPQPKPQQNTSMPTASPTFQAAPVSAPSPPKPLPPTAPLKTIASDGSEPSGLSFIPWGNIAGLAIFCFLVLGNGWELMNDKLGKVLVPELNKLSLLPMKMVNDREQQGNLAGALIAAAILLAIRFIWHEVSMLRQPSKRQTVSQLVVASMASVFFGYGNVFLLSWAGMYTAA